MNDTILEYLGSCHYISASDNQTLPCEAWEYNRTDYQSTIVTDASIILFYNLFYHNCFIVFVQWDLVCDRRWMASVSQSVYMFGCVTGSLLLGHLSDRWVWQHWVNLVLPYELVIMQIMLFINLLKCIYIDMAERSYCSRPDCSRYACQLPNYIFIIHLYNCHAHLFVYPPDILCNRMRLRKGLLYLHRSSFPHSSKRYMHLHDWLCPKLTKIIL